MKTSLPLQLIAASALLAACGPPELVAVPDNPYSNDDSDVVQNGPLTMVASRSSWYERALSKVSTPIEVMLVNRGKRNVPVNLEELELVDERGRVYRALPAQTIASRLFGGSPPPPESYLEPEPVQPPSAQPPDGSDGPMQEPPPETMPGVQSPPPAKGASPSQTLAPTLDPGIILVAGHSGGGGHVASGHAVGGARGGAVGGQRFGGRGYLGRGYYGYGGRFGYGYGVYGGWGGAPWGWGGWGWGWGFGPAYVVGLGVTDYDYPGYDPREFEHLGPWQVYQVALRPTDLKPNQRMGGLVFFEPAWDAKFLTLRFHAQPEGGAPLEMQARFEVQ